MLDRNRICDNDEKFLRSRAVTFLNPYSFLKLAQSGVSLEKFDGICIDGVALKLFLNLVYRDFRIRRLSFDFTSVAGLIFERAVNNSLRGFVVGSDDESNQKFLEDISIKFPGIQLEGRHGYFSDECAMMVTVEELVRAEYDFVIVGMGAVKQEEFVNCLIKSGYRGCSYTCGGFIHQTAMAGGEYYPRWIDKLNLRFAYRMFKEPTTISRYLVDYPRAFALFTANIRSFKH